ncbi:hypothetical protein BSF43_18770 [Pseudomonas ogarae]|uniref:hypothetical protein n=1 Tax=Pseudomonas ogarae (strain DSM 112162 / CECT 30235 / F113) TaxID=1114970 RepID=UPI001143FA20|nr:hypothetical protein [Pseudomonas ogarae]PBJ12922.1 hypothetical protein BSF43_18770 [Pseudomonas ogarae]
MNSKLSIALVFFCLATSAYGAKKNSDPAPWAQEPTTFLGIKLDEKLIYQLKLCPNDYSVPAEICYQRPFQGYYPLFAVPSLGLHGYTAGVLTHDSLVREVVLNTKVDDYEAVMALLTQKYGRPQSQKTEMVKTKVGATFQNEKSYWEGKKVGIILSKYSDDIDTSSVSVINKTVAAKALQDERGKVDENASKL